jgi:hypothetical protein
MLMGLLGEATRPLLEELASVVSPVLEWSQQDAAAEVERTIQLLEKAHGAMAAAQSKSPLRRS